MAGLEHAPGRRRIGQDLAGEQDADPFRHALQPWRPRIVPDAFLPRTGRHWFGCHVGALALCICIFGQCPRSESDPVAVAFGERWRQVALGQRAALDIGDGLRQ